MRIRHVLQVTCACAVAAAGCYTYTPTESPRPGMEVRAQLENEAAIRRSEGLDDPITRYDGVIVDMDQEALSLDVLVARSTSMFQDVVIRDTIRLPRTELRSIMERKFSPVRTGLVTVAAVAGAAAIVLGIDAVVGGTGDDNGEPPPQSMRILIMSLTGSGLSPAFLGSRRE